MRLFLAIIPFLLLLACSKKAHILNTTQISSHLKETNDSIGKKKLFIVDKSIITTDTDLDTLITIKGSSLSGSLGFNESVKHFENNDFSIDFKKDQTGLSAQFKVSAKAKVINARYHLKTTTQNNVVKTENSKSTMQTQINLHQDSVYKYVSDRREPGAVANNIKSVIIWLIVLLVVATAIFFVLKRKAI